MDTVFISFQDANTTETSPVTEEMWKTNVLHSIFYLDYTLAVFVHSIQRILKISCQTLPYNPRIVNSRRMPPVYMRHTGSKKLK
ncbi:unnamed protein product [Heterobilharzia americana]|nr:unnamed protein product [Heterobilharzia americana]